MSADACGCCGKPPGECDCWVFPGWGKVERVLDLPNLPAEETGKSPTRLGVWKATAICGNDITSSCLYVSALAALYAGPLAPLALLLVAGVLFLFRSIYAEVGSALPLNGGAYNVLLNTTTKSRAALAACLTLLSYIATAVISGSEAMNYAAELLPTINVFWATVILLGGFAVLNVMGISDSASVALGIFVFHLCTLAALVAIGVMAIIADPTIFVENIRTPMNQWPTPRSGGMMIALVFGFSAAMLGISGFESSANYIEEQKPGVFPKTLRNMWIAVALFNPVISLLSFALLPMSEIATYKEALLSEMGRRGVMSVGGFEAHSFLPRMASGWISLDAVVVLSGAVLTSYVGVTGLVRRMSMDLCLPQFLLLQNRRRGTNHWIIISFFLLCCSILLITSGKIEMLAGVYTLSFLSVMALFALGNLLLKARRPDLKRATHAKRLAVAIALGGVLLALVGNVVLNPDYVRVFLLYFAASVGVVALMRVRNKLLIQLLKVAKTLCGLPLLRRCKTGHQIATLLQEVQCRAIIFVASDGSPNEMRRAAEYVRRNEQMRILKVAWCYDVESEIPQDMPQIREEIDKEFRDLHIDLLLVRGKLGPSLLRVLGQRMGVPLNYMFITSATAGLIDDLADWGGVRIIA